jgi:FtsH-binding integral membrane protein
VEAYTVGVIVTYYDKMVVLEAFGLTAAVTVSLTGGKHLIYIFENICNESFDVIIFAIVF